MTQSAINTPPPPHTHTHTHRHTQTHTAFFPSLSPWNIYFSKNILGFRFSPKLPVSIWSLCCEMLKMVILTLQWEEKKMNERKHQKYSCGFFCSHVLRPECWGRVMKHFAGGFLVNVVSTCEVNKIITLAVEQGSSDQLQYFIKLCVWLYSVSVLISGYRWAIYHDWRESIGTVGRPQFK